MMRDSGYHAVDLGILLILVASAFLAGCVANRAGDILPAENAAIVCILKGGQKCGK